MKNFGIIDIGSNSIRLVLIEIFEGKYYRVIEDVKETVRLGMDISKDDRLNPMRMGEALRVLKRFKSLYEELPECKVKIVATEAVRRASNQKEFLEMIIKLGMDVKVLTGQEEAYYDYFGVINTLDLENGLIIDIGGCSTELVWFGSRRILETASLPMGGINITQAYSLSEGMNISSEKKLAGYIQAELLRIPWLIKASGLPLIGVGGSIRNLGKISRKNKNYPLDLSHNYSFPSFEVTDIYNWVKYKNTDQRKKLKGLSPERTDIFAGAASIAAAVVDLCSSGEVIISGSGLREGLIYEHLYGREPINDILENSLENVLEILNLDKTLAFKLWELSEKLFEYNRTRHNFTNETKRILKTAALLYNCGRIINFYGNHKHTLYMMLNLPLNGLTHRELIMSAYTVLLSAKEAFCLENSEYTSLLSDQDKGIIQSLSTILRLAKYLLKRNSNFSK